jgi:hypothetical protein
MAKVSRRVGKSLKEAWSTSLFIYYKLFRMQNSDELTINELDEINLKQYLHLKRIKFKEIINIPIIV